MVPLARPPALWWVPEGTAVRCLLCPHGCLLSPGDIGRCGVRRHDPREGLVACNDGLVAALAVDPVEKKPLYHFHPGTQILSLGTFGCNMRCPFCQNWHLSQGMEWGDPASAWGFTTPEMVRDEARRRGLDAVAFTYNEPFVWFEFVRRCARSLRSSGIAVVLVTNGLVNPEPLEELLPDLDAANVDMKAFDATVYREVLGGDLEAVCHTVEALRRAEKHVELTFLLVPGINNDLDLFSKLLSWIAVLPGKIPPPLHISRSFPRHRWSGPSPTLETMHRYAAEARKVLPHVYLGNTDEPGITRCCRCRRDIFVRQGYTAFHNSLDEWGKCGYCGEDNGIVLPRQD